VLEELADVVALVDLGMVQEGMVELEGLEAMGEEEMVALEKVASVLALEGHWSSHHCQYILSCSHCYRDLLHHQRGSCRRLMHLPTCSNSTAALHFHGMH